MEDTKDSNDKDTTITYLKNVYIENIPMEALQDPDLPKRYRYQLGFVAYTVMGFLFLYSLVTNFQTSLKERYMSFQSDSGNCETVSKPLTGTFKMDYYGNWEGSTLFQPNQALYEIEFNRLSVDDETFRSIIQDINTHIIQPFVEYAHWLPLYYILLYHMGNEHSIDVNGNKHSFRFNGYPKRVYDAETFFGGVASTEVSGCNFQGEPSAYLDAGFDYQSGTLHLHYDYQSYVNSSQCMGALNTSQIIMALYSTPRQLKFEINIESLIVADAVNKMLIPFQNMVMATSERYDFQYIDGYNYTYTSWYYPRYPDMDPIWCILGVDEKGNMLNDSSIYDRLDVRWSGRVLPPFICVLKWVDAYKTDGTLQSHYFFPMFQHLFPGCQSCPSRPTYTEQLQQPVDVCDNMYFFTSLLYFPHSSNTSILDMISYWFLKDQSGAESWAAWLGMESNGASWTAAFGGESSVFNNLQHDIRDFPYGTNYSDMFAFCRGDCSIISIGSVNNEFTISKDFFSLRKGACRDSMSTPYWDKFTTPPQPLVEPYFSCTQTTWDAFNDALGIASGFAASLGSLALLLLLPCVYLFKEEKVGRSKEELISKLGDLLVETENTRRITKNELDANDVLKLLNELTEPEKQLWSDDIRNSKFQDERKVNRAKYCYSTAPADDQIEAYAPQVVETENCDDNNIKNIVNSESPVADSPITYTSTMQKSESTSMNHVESSSLTGFNWPRGSAGIRSSRVKRVSMSDGKIQIQEKDSDDEDENTAILDENQFSLTQSDHNLKKEGGVIENDEANCFDIGGIECEKNDGIDIYDNVIIPEISRSDNTSPTLPINTRDGDDSNISVDGEDDEYSASGNTSDPNYLQIF